MPSWKYSPRKCRVQNFCDVFTSALVTDREITSPVPSEMTTGQTHPSPAHSCSFLALAGTVGHSKKLSVSSTQGEMHSGLFVSITALFSGTPEIPEGCFIAWWECSEGNIPGSHGSGGQCHDCLGLLSPGGSIPAFTGSIFLFVVLCFLYIIQR